MNINKKNMDVAAKTVAKYLNLANPNSYKASTFKRSAVAAIKKMPTY